MPRHRIAADRLPDEPNVLGAHLREHGRVDSLPIDACQNVLELHREHLLPVALELKRIQRLPAARGTYVGIAIHAAKIVDR